MKNWMTSTWQRVLLGLALSALSAGLLILAFPPFNLWFLVWLSFVPFILAQYRIMPPKMASVSSAAFNGLWLWGYLGPVFGGTGNFMAYLPLIVAISCPWQRRRGYLESSIGLARPRCTL